MKSAQLKSRKRRKFSPQHRDPDNPVGLSGNRRIRKQCRGEAYYFRFADDFLACFQYKGDAEHFKNILNDRLEGFGLEVAEEKTRCIEFGRFARPEARSRGQKPKEFTFLGFTHYCGKTKLGHFRVKRRTSRKKLAQSLRNFTEWARKSRAVLRKGLMLRRALHDARRCGKGYYDNKGDVH